VSAADEVTPCVACGALVPPGSAACARCGAAAPAVAGPRPGGAPITPPSAPTPPPSASTPPPSAPTPPPPVSPPAPTGPAAIAAAAGAARAAAAPSAVTRRPVASRDVSPPAPAKKSPSPDARAWTTSAAGSPLTPHQARVAHTVAEAVGISDGEAATLFADGVSKTRASGGRRKSRRGVVAVLVVMAFLGMRAWGCFDFGGPTTPTGTTTTSTYDGGPGPPSAADRDTLRRNLDSLMTVNSGLPQTVDEPLPDAGREARLLARQLRLWQRLFDASAADEELASAGAAFADALADWVEHPDRAGTYKAYVRAWNAWDRADDTWESAD
jgi:hypothetical protein